MQSQQSIRERVYCEVQCLSMVFQEVATYAGEERASSSMLFKLGVLVVPISDLSEIIEARKNKWRSRSRIETRVRFTFS
jgi:hypothetical protein